MSDLTQNFDRPRKGHCRSKGVELGAIHAYRGDLLMVIRGTGTAVRAANTIGGQIAGVADEELDNSGGATGRIIRVLRGVHLFSKANAAITDIGQMATAVDSDTVEVDGSEAVNVGRIVQIKDATHVWVDLDAIR